MSCEPELEVVQLVGGAFDGDLGEAEWERLRALLREDPEVRRYYLEHAELQAMLAWEHAAPQVLESGPQGRTRRRWGGLALAAAVVVAGLFPAWVWWSGGRGDDGLPAGTGEVGRGGAAVNFARLIAEEEADWERGVVGSELEVGGWLPDGRVRLRSGRVVLTFDSGVVVVADGPVALDVEGPNRGYLHLGRVVAQVPEQASGFLLNTPSSSLIDVGTRFGAVVRDDGTTEVHVLEGQVEVTDVTTAAGGATRLLSDGEAAVVQAGAGAGVETTAFDAGAFEAQLEKLERVPNLEPVNFVHWAFDEGEGRATRGRWVGVDGSERDYVGVLEGSPQASGRWVDGVRGAALAFDGADEWLSTDYPGVQGRGARTVSFWVKTPPRSPATAGDVPGILTWGGFDHAGAKWELVPNPYGHNGAVGAVRLSCKYGFVVGSTDIQNGRWHHVAVVFTGGGEGGLVESLRLYVDGRLEPFSGFLRGVVNTDTTSDDAVPLTVGRYADPTQPIEGYLRGVLDELYIFEGALTPQQIERLWREGEP